MSDDDHGHTGEVYVVTHGVDSEGADVIGVTATPEAGRALADSDAKRPLPWEVSRE